MKIEDCKIGMHVRDNKSGDIGWIVTITEFTVLVQFNFGNKILVKSPDNITSFHGITEEKSKHSHYFKDASHLSAIDVYRVLELFGVTDQKIGHAVKKLLCAGQRGQKDIGKDIQEAIDSLERWKSMREEDVAATPSATSGVLDDRTRESIMSKINEWERLKQKYGAAGGLVDA
jgi:hypothetical protein